MRTRLLGLVVVGLSSCTTTHGNPIRFSEFRGAEHQQEGSAFLSVDNGANADPVVEKAERETTKTLKKAQEMSPSAMIAADFRLVLQNFMPGRRPGFEILIGFPALAFALGVAWLVAYWHLIYTNDRAEDRKAWEGQERIPRQEDERIKHVKPDFILLFHHPGFAYSDKETEISVKNVRNIMVKKHQTGYLSKIEECLDKQHEKASMFTTMTASVGGALKSGARSMGLRRQNTHVDSVDMQTKDEEAAQDAEEEAEKVTLGSMRQLLLQDLYTALPEAGFEIITFSSIDDDEIFVGISLEDPEIIREELIRANVKLQLQPSVVEKLGVGQDPNEMESSPPFLKYDPRIAQNVFGEDKTERDFYKTFHGKNEAGSIISGVERIRLIQRHLFSHVNLDVATQEGILKDWYPCHSTYWLQELDACWSRLSLLKDLTFLQPMPLIQQYFGSRVAFTCAWNGLYCKMLLALVPVAILFEIVDFSGSHVGTSIKGIVLTFSLVLAIWSKVAYNLWEREQEYFMVLWDLNKAPDYSVRPDFHGTYEEDPVDSTQKSLQYPRNLYVMRQATAWLITIMFCTLVGVCVFVWISLFDGQLDIVASICLAIMIQVFQFVYNSVAEASTKWENHKYQVEFYQSYLMKLFIFQFVNQFSAYFFIAVKQRHTRWGCPQDDCIGLLRRQLSTTLVVISALQIVNVVLASVKVKIFMWWEDRQLKQTLAESGQEMPVRGFVEEQAKYEEYRVRAQIENMVQLVISLGYVLIFGAVAPRIVPLCFLVFAVQLRATAYMTTQACRRPLPRKSPGLGAWQGIVKFMMGFGVVFSGFLLVSYGPSFEGTFLMTKVSGLILYISFTFLFWELVSLVVSPAGKQAKVLHDRREYVLHKVAQANEEANIAQLKKTYKKDSSRRKTVTGKILSGGSAYGEEIGAGAWEKIPHLVDAKYEDHGASPRGTGRDLSSSQMTESSLSTQ